MSIISRRIIIFLYLYFIIRIITEKKENYICKIQTKLTKQVKKLKLQMHLILGNFKIIF